MVTDSLTSPTTIDFQCLSEGPYISHRQRSLIRSLFFLFVSRVLLFSASPLPSLSSLTISLSLVQLHGVRLLRGCLRIFNVCVCVQVLRHHCNLAFVCLLLLRCG